jgi:mono/diheme cytochrome c family protein
VLVVLLVAGGYVAFTVNAYGRSMSQVYEIPLPTLASSTDSAVIERGRHLAESVAGCATADCHGTDLGGGNTIEAGPVGSITAPNITSGGLGSQYSDGELARILLHGVKRDGRSASFMPSQDFAWLPDSDIVAIISFVRSVPPVQRPSVETRIGLLGKVLDRRDLFEVDVARRIDHEQRPQAPAPEPTARYGAFLAKGCVGCHGEGLSGGKIPGAPPSMPIPTNLTPHESGLRSWAYEDFERALNTGTRPDGRKIDPFMPFESFSKLNDTEKRALWAYLQSLPAKPFGER